MVDSETRLQNARWVLAMLERLSADSIYAHRASGMRGSILRLLDTPDPAGLDRLIEQGFDILEKAAAELRGVEDIRTQIQQMRNTNK